ncbi:MAG: MinD/ParA family protein [Clostridia bacterium]|nr:MinD/ParA family protein [Clostridia bacterium]
MDQAAKLRERALNRRNLKAPTRVIAVTSGKGGVGKTNLVVNLAICLASSGRKVALLDADLGTANVDVLLGIIPKHSLYDVLNGRKKIEEITIKGPAGVNFIPGGSGYDEMMFLSKLKKKAIEEGIGNFTGKQDFLFIDTGAGISRNVLAFVSAASEVIVVVTPEPTSIADAYALIKVLWKFNLNERIHLLVNMATSFSEARQTAERITAAAKHFLKKEINVLGYVLDDECVGKAVKKQMPFVLQYPRARASYQIKNVAKNLMMGKVHTDLAKERFASRILRFFG